MIKSLCLYHIQNTAPPTVHCDKVILLEQLFLLHEKGERLTGVKMLENCVEVLLFFYKMYIEKKYIKETGE